MSAIQVIDTDSHVTEPPDLWTSRLSEKKWGDSIPNVKLDDKRSEYRWHIGGHRLFGVANWAMAGWPEYPPGHPPSLEDADPGSFDADARLGRMDEYGLYAQVLYPNLLAFAAQSFLSIADHDLRLECVRAYNDFLVDFATPAPNRFILLTALPFWDVEQSVAEIRRCKELGHQGILFASKPYKVGLPNLRDEHWAPIFECAQELELSVNFHVGFQEMDLNETRDMIGRKADRIDYAKS